MVDEVYSSVLDIKVKPEFHKYLIGKKRANVKRVCCKNNVHSFLCIFMTVFMIVDSRPNQYQNNFPT